METLKTENSLNLTATELADAFRAGTLSIGAHLELLFKHIEENNARLNAMTSTQKEYALKRAQELSSRKPFPHEVLYGVPVVIKENIQKKGFPLSCASKILEGYHGQFDATAVEKLESAGAILIGTANMDEFAMGSSNEHSIHGPVRNPHDPTRVSGGSSGGSAVACASLFAPLALGSDTGGSVRQPAAYCGIFGYKPTYGRVSRYGLVAYGSSLDQISPFARSGKDLNLIMSVIGQQDPKDATSLAGHYESAPSRTLKGTRVGVIRGLLKEGVSENVLSAFRKLEDLLREQGVEFVDVEVEHLEHTLSVYYLIACAEASSNLARFDGIRYGYRSPAFEDLKDLYCKTRSEGFGQEVKLRIMLGTFALSAGYYDAFYGKAQAVRDLMSESFARVFKNVDFLFLPTAPTSAFKIGEKLTDPVQMYLNDIFTIPANLAGLCAVSVPALIPEGELPVGLQFFGAKGADAHLLAFIQQIEMAGLVGCTPLRGK